MATWHLAATLVQLRKEVNDLYPLRDKTSDGTLGNAAHSSRLSDHNPDDDRAVCAIDIDEDLTGSANPTYPRFNPGQAAKSRLVDELLALAKAGKVPQLYYVIYERVIYSRTRGFAPKVYTGVNAHEHHVHVSVYHDDRLKNSTKPWGLTPLNAPKPPAVYKPDPANLGTVYLSKLHPGVKDSDSVWQYQVALKKLGLYTQVPTGEYGKVTTAAVRAFQLKDPALAVDADGDTGPLTAKKVFSAAGNVVRIED